MVYGMVVTREARSHLHYSNTCIADVERVEIHNPGDGWEPSIPWKGHEPQQTPPTNKRKKRGEDRRKRIFTTPHTTTPPPLLSHVQHNTTDRGHNSKPFCARSIRALVVIAIVKKKFFQDGKYQQFSQRMKTAEGA
jgi:hypothetical protein